MTNSTPEYKIGDLCYLKHINCFAVIENQSQLDVVYMDLDAVRHASNEEMKRFLTANGFTEDEEHKLTQCKALTGNQVSINL